MNRFVIIAENWTKQAMAEMIIKAIDYQLEFQEKLLEQIEMSGI